jgi:glyoxylase-like metal-dependent hydrolase (beta-lactamase superfamily II)
MREIAENVWHIPLVPRDAVNAYVLGDVLVDAGMPMHGKKLPGKLGGHTITAHTLTHAHPDHVGGSKNVVDALGVPFWAPEGDAAAVEAGVAVQKDSKVKKLVELTAKFPPVPIARRLREGDEVAGFTVLDTPGHSPGHISFWRESDRTLICGDVWFHINFLTLRPQLRAPFSVPTVDPARNRRSMQRLIDLRPETVGFGHGPVMTGAAQQLRVVGG